jgi:hypothetical protein
VKLPPPGFVDRLFRSAGVRFGVIYAALFGISAAALAAFLWWSTLGLLDRQTDAAIETDAQALAERYAAGGLLAVREVIRQRIDSNADDDAVYLLTDPAFVKIEGNLDGWPRGMMIDSEREEMRIMRDDVSVTSVLHHYELPSGFHLLVGRDVEAKTGLRRLMTDAMIWAAGIALALGSVGAWAVRGLFRAMLADVAATASAIGAGDLTRRVRVTGQGDEFDLLAGTINDMLDRIETLMDGVRQVSNAIAHDLRTPITRARNRLEEASTHATTPEALHAAIERAEADLDGVMAIFQALLRIAEIEAGSRRSAFAGFDAVPLLVDLAELYEAVAEERGQVFKADLPGSLPMFGDRDMVQQAVANLIDNAVKFTPEGGAITLAASATPGDITISVTDGGPGIPATDRSRATERFFRGETARSTPGSGLGLALVQAVAQLHGGVLTLDDNAPGLRASLRLRATES